MATAPQLDDISCPLCSSSRHQDWGRENGFTAVRCSDCSLVYVNPRPRLADISEGTRLGEHPTPEGRLGVAYRRSSAKTVRYGRILADLLAGELSGEPVEWLDIGAGYGEVMEALATILPPGSGVTGIEPMTLKAAVARQRGLRIEARPLGEIERRFDGISLINVFSHLPDPQAFFHDVVRLLKPGGILVCETGNGGDMPSAADYPDRLDLPDHLIFAGVETLCTFLERAGLTVVASKAFRRDTIGWVAKNLVKALIGRKVRLTLPGQSAFRTMFFVARLAPSTVATIGATLPPSDRQRADESVSSASDADTASLTR